MLTRCWLQYWVVYSFLTVIESAINASYWFPFYYTFKFIFVMYLALPQTQYVPETSNPPTMITPTNSTHLGAPKSSSAP